MFTFSPFLERLKHHVRALVYEFVFSLDAFGRQKPSWLETGRRGREMGRMRHSNARQKAAEEERCHRIARKGAQTVSSRIIWTAAYVFV